MEMNVLDASCLGISLFLQVAYHLHVVYTVSKSPLKTVYGLSRSARRIWIASIMFRKQDILAIQTLRNWIMASSFLASTAVAICFGFIAFLASAKIGLDGSVGSVALFSSDGWFQYKVITLLGLLTFSFLCFTQAIRYFNHVALMININITSEELATLHPSSTLAHVSITKDRVADVMNRGGLAHALGMRGYYITVTIVAWLFGPVSLLVGTILMICVMTVVDFNIEWLEIGKKKRKVELNGDGDGGDGGVRKGRGRKKGAWKGWWKVNGKRNLGMNGELESVASTGSEIGNVNNEMRATSSSRRSLQEKDKQMSGGDMVSISMHGSDAFLTAPGNTFSSYHQESGNGGAGARLRAGSNIGSGSANSGGGLHGSLRGGELSGIELQAISDRLQEVEDRNAKNRPTAMSRQESVGMGMKPGEREAVLNVLE
ncbi:hypothetical protein HDU76_000379 [Blyttiomyces sp. JEL0837]|nr:hypothetical protein HDU76_000379 [Blyttiomyces sp. JEL0837]